MKELEFTTSNKSTGLNIQSTILEISNSVIIGLNSGIELTNEDGIVIIGDNIPSLKKGQNNVIYIGDKIIVGKTLMGQPNTMYDILKEQNKQ